MDIAAELKEKLIAVKLFLFDVDGVMTDGSIIYTNGGDEIKRFNVRDGHGLKLLMGAGIEVGIITARNSKIVERRAGELGIKHVMQSCSDKLSAFEEIVVKTGIDRGECAYVGDDIIDIPVLKSVGFAAAPADGCNEVTGIVDYVTSSPGGRGAVRELAELVLKAQGRWDGIISGYYP